MFALRGIAVAQNAIPTDAFIYNGKSGGSLLARQAIRQKVGPVGVIALVRPHSICNGIAESHDCPGLVRSRYFNIRQPVP